jgi:hypothetical protein
MQISRERGGADLARQFGAVKSSFDVVASFLDEAPVDLTSMAKALGLSVDMHANLPEGASGRITKIEPVRNSVCEA